MTPAGFPHSDIARIAARSAAPRGISQLAASFITSRSQGIPHTPLVAYPHILQSQHLAVQSSFAGIPITTALAGTGGAADVCLPKALVFTYSIQITYVAFVRDQTFLLVTEPAEEPVTRSIRQFF